MRMTVALKALVVALAMAPVVYVEQCRAAEGPLRK
jgi:hypothetical protein